LHYTECKTYKQILKATSTAESMLQFGCVSVLGSGLITVDHLVTWF